MRDLGAVVAPPRMSGLREADDPDEADVVVALGAVVVPRRTPVERADGEAGAGRAAPVAPPRAGALDPDDADAVVALGAVVAPRAIPLGRGAGAARTAAPDRTPALGEETGAAGAALAARTAWKAL